MRYPGHIETAVIPNGLRLMRHVAGHRLSTQHFCTPNGTLNVYLIPPPERRVHNKPTLATEH